MVHSLHKKKIQNRYVRKDRNVSAIYEVHCKLFMPGLPYVKLQSFTRVGMLCQHLASRPETFYEKTVHRSGVQQKRPLNSKMMNQNYEVKYQNNQYY